MSPTEDERTMPAHLNLEERQRRRAQRRRELRRRRRLLAAGACTLALLVLLGILLHGGGSNTAQHRRSSAATARPASDSAGTPAPASTAQSSGRPGRDAVPILMYHVIAAPPAGAPFPGLYVPPAEFREQMQALKSAGWHAVTLDQVAAYWRHGASLGAGKPIVVSFDNGYNTQYTEALPVLRALGWVGVENLQLSGLPPSQGGLGEGQVHGLLAAGWELDTQGISHADLVTLGASALRYQVDVARQTLQRRYHVPVNWFCYPSGHYDATVVAAVRAAGFAGSTTVIPGWAHPSDDRYRLHRLRVLGGTGGSQLLDQLAAIRDEPPAPGSYGS